MPEVSTGRKQRVIEGAKSILTTRGYSVGKITEENEVTDIVGSRKGAKKKKETIVIRIPDKEVVGVKLLRDFRKDLESPGFDHAILLALGKYTHYAKKEAIQGGIETFSIDFPFFDLFQHDLVPTHEIASPKEIEELSKTLFGELHKLPKIFSTDPAAQLLGAKPGEVLKITRQSVTAGEFIAYRYVME